MMSTYDKFSKAVQELERGHGIINLAISGSITAGLFYWIYTLFSPNVPALFYFWSIFLFLLASVLISILVDQSRTVLSSKYRQEKKKIEKLRKMMAALRNRVDSIFQQYPSRGRGQQFKKVYSLAGKNLAELERTLAVAMFREEKEVFVTAFMRKEVAVRVTASIGSANTCSNSDNIKKWPEHIKKLGCDEIRQYHNHPTIKNETSPSAQDYRTTRDIKQMLGSYAPRLRSLIIYWNEIREWRILEYDDSPSCRIIYCFDAAG